MSEWEFDDGLLTNLPRIIVACNFYPSSVKLKTGILPVLTYQTIARELVWYCISN